VPYIKNQKSQSLKLGQIKKTRTDRHRVPIHREASLQAAKDYGRDWLAEQ
jgi:hypothetical protein